jgi:membrane protein YqaA with SNARE-associated domain
VLSSLKVLLKKYTAFIAKLLLPLGPLGVLAAAALDAAFYGLPVDAVVIAFVIARPSQFVLYPLMASVGSALGSLVIYAIGRKGEELVLEKHISPQRLERIRDRFQRQEFFALMIPAMLPPPTPFKLFVLSAGVFRMKVRDFLLAIFCGRMVRFLLVGALIRYFGPEIAQIAQRMFHEHRWLTATAVLALVALIGLVIYLWRRPVKELAEEIEK